MTNFNAFCLVLLICILNNINFGAALQVLMGHGERCLPPRAICNLESELSCQRGVCSCSVGYTYSLILQKCMREDSSPKRGMRVIQMLGYACGGRLHCDRSIGHRCQRGICSCNTSHVLSRDQLSCLQVAAHANNSCLEDEQCHRTFGVHSTCQSGACACKDDAPLSDGKCRNTSMISIKVR